MDYLKYIAFGIFAAFIPNFAWSNQLATTPTLEWWSEFMNSIVESEGQALVIVFVVLVCVFVGCILKNPEIH